jgi:hypothetical protein
MPGTLVGIVGKPNAGKSTFLNAACLTSAKVADYPFTTIDPNPGKAYVKRPCVCRQLNVTDNPKNSICQDGIRLAPIDMLDVAGLVPGAHEGKGRGNKFLSDLGQADVLLHIIDFSGATNEQGEIVAPGTTDPLDDIKFLEDEICYWLKQIVERDSKDWDKFLRASVISKTTIHQAIFERLSGLGVTENQVTTAIKDAGLQNKKLTEWGDDGTLEFARALQKVAKPIVLVANKVDRAEGRKNFERISAMPEYEGKVFPCSALAEFFLRTLAKNEIIDYVPGASEFTIQDEDRLSAKEKTTLDKIKSDILDVFGSTGIQAAIDKAIFEILEYIFVYPVQDQNKFTDHDGRVLPDVFLVKNGTKLIDFVARKIHTDLAKNFIHGINAKNQRRLSGDYELQPDDVVKIVAAK